MKRITTVILLLIICMVYSVGCSSEDLKAPARWCAEEAIRENDSTYPNETVLGYRVVELGIPADIQEEADSSNAGVCLYEIILIIERADGIYERTYLAEIVYTQDSGLYTATAIVESQILDCDVAEIKVGD